MGLHNEPKIYFANFNRNLDFNQDHSVNKRNFYEYLDNNNGVTNFELDKRLDKNACVVDIIKEKRRYDQEGGDIYYVKIANEC